MNGYDAVIVGAGPNGLTAAARLALAGRRVLVIEAKATIGGGARTEPFGPPGVVQDVCSTVHPFGIGSPAFTALGLERHGLRWLHPEIPLAHPLDDGSAALLHRDVGRTAEGLGTDGPAYEHLMAPLVRDFDAIRDIILQPIPWSAVGRGGFHPFVLARFGLKAAQPARLLARRFQDPKARALLAGISAHTVLPLNQPFTGGVGLALGLFGHAVGWPVAAGGSQAIVDALAAVVTEHDGEIVTDQPVTALASLPPAAAVLLDVTPRQFLDLAGDRLTTRGMAPYRRFRYGPGSCKADYVLSAPMPWTAEAAHRAATVHVGGPFEDVARSEADAMAGRLSEKPFVLAVQPGVADPSRSPDGLHVLWAYCHVPHGSPIDASDRIERQLDRFAPGWRRLIVTKTVRTATDYEQYNANDVGGDIAGGSMGGLQLLFRPRFGLDPYATPIPGVWLCSSSTPPGGGVHGMSGWHAAGRVLARTR